MIVAIVNKTVPVGIVKVEQFRTAVDEAMAVADYAAAYGVPAGDYLGFDTGWATYQYTTSAKHWAYDFGSPGLVQEDNADLTVCFIISLSKDDIAITSDGSWEVLGRFVLAPDELCEADRFVLRPRFAYRSTGGTPQLRIVENVTQYGAVAQFTDQAGWTRDKFRAAGVAGGGMNTYTLEGDRNGATLFELRGVTIEIAKRSS